MVEIWKPIKGYEGFYEVSNTGKVKSVIRTVIDKNGRVIPLQGRILRACFVCSENLAVVLMKGNKRDPRIVARLVAEAFIPNSNKLLCVRHKDGNKLNNNVSNLEWCTRGENYKEFLKTRPKRIGENSTNHKLTYKEADFIRKNYIPKDKNFGRKALAKKFNVGSTTIYEIVNNLRWKEI